MPSLVKIGIGFKLVLKGRNENEKSLQTDRRTKKLSIVLFNKISEAFIHTCKNSVYHLIIKQNSQL